MSLHHNTWKLRSARAFIVLAGIMVASVILAEVLGGKMFSVEKFLGFSPLHFDIMGYSLDMNLPMGFLIWPFLFVLSDIINDFYGVSGVRFVTWFAVISVILAVVVIHLASNLTPAPYYPSSHTQNGIKDMNAAYEIVLLRSTRVLIASVLAFIVAQFLNAIIFRTIKKSSNSKRLWLRSSVSTIIAQGVSSYIYLYVAFNLGSRYMKSPEATIWPMKQVIAVGTMHLCYGAGMAVVMLPILYLIHGMLSAYLGSSVANLMVREAAKN